MTFDRGSSPLFQPGMQTQCLEVKQPSWNHEVHSHTLRIVGGGRRLVPCAASPTQHSPPLDSSWCKQNRHLFWLGPWSWVSVPWAERETHQLSSLPFGVNTVDIYPTFSFSQTLEHPQYVWGNSDIKTWASPQQNSENKNAQAPPSMRLWRSNWCKGDFNSEKLEKGIYGLCPSSLLVSSFLA